MKFWGDCLFKYIEMWESSSPSGKEIEDWKIPVRVDYKNGLFLVSELQVAWLFCQKHFMKIGSALT